MRAKPPVRRTRGPATARPAAPRSAPLAPPEALTPRARAGVGIVVIAAWAILFLPQLFLGQAFVMGDARHYRPFAEFSRARWESLHQRTHWNPFLLAGLPATASLADARPQYLPDAALDLYERVRIGRWIPMGAPLFAHLAGMLAMALLARRVAGAGAFGMMFAGIAWGFLPDLVVPLAYGQDAKVVTMSLTPVALVALHATLTADGPRAGLAAVALALVTGVMVLTGHPQFVVYAGLVLAAFAVVTALSLRRASRLAWVAGAAALAGVMSAAVWMPAMLYGAHSFRGGVGVPIDEVRDLSFAWRDLLSLGWPHAVGSSGAAYWGGLGDTDYPRYVGASVLALAGLAIAGGRLRSATDRQWLGLALFGIVFSIGARLGFVYTLMSHVLPFAARFRVASAVLFIAELALVLIAVRAFSLPAPDPAHRARPGAARALLMGITVALLLAGIGLALGPLADTYAGFAIQARPGMAGSLAFATAREAGFDLVLRMVFAAAAAFLMVVVASKPGRAGPIARAALVALLAIDLGSIAIPAARRASGPASALGPLPAPELAKVAAAHPSARVWSTRRMRATPEYPDTTIPRQEAMTNDWIAWRARNMAGDHGAPPAFWRTLRQVSPTLPSVAALGVTYVSAEAGPAWDSTLFERIAERPDEVVYRFRGALGRTYAVPEVVAPGDDGQILARMSANDFDPRTVAYASAPAAAGTYPGSRGARIEWIRDDPDTLALAVEAPDRAFVVIADSDVPGWTARLNGQTVPIQRVNLLARGIVVPAGRHRLDLDYVPEGWVRGVALTRAGLLVWALAALVALAWSFRNRRAPRPA
jgi:hypothetical protein